MYKVTLAEGSNEITFDFGNISAMSTFVCEALANHVPVEDSRGIKKRLQVIVEEFDSGDFMPF